jgi:hypothetical protein
MYGAQFDAANRLALEPRQRLSALQGMLSLLPTTRSTTTFNPQATGFNPLLGILQLLGGGVNLPGIDPTILGGTG